MSSAADPEAASSDPDPPSRHAHPHRRRARWVAVIVFLVLLGLAAAGAATARLLVAAEARARFDADAQSIAAAVDGEVRAYVEALQGARGFVAHSEEVTYEEWQGYVAMLDLEHRYTALRALSLNVVVTADEVDALEDELTQTLKTRGITDEAVAVRPDGIRSHYVVVKHIAPMEGNAGAIGFDIASPSDRSEAVERAARTGQAAATGPVDLVQTEERDTGMLIVLPVYRPDVDAERGLGIQDTAAFVVAVVDVAELMEDAVAGFDAPMRLRVIDEGPIDLGSPAATGPTVALIYSSATEAAAPGAPTRFLVDHRIDVAGRQWRMTASTGTAYVTPLAAATPGAILAGGGAFGILAGFFTYGQLTNRVRAEETARRLTAELRQSEAQRTLMMSKCAHELNGALTPIRIQMYLLRSGTPLPPGATDEAYAVIARNAAHLERLVSDLLDVTQLSLGRLRIQPSPFDLTDVVGEAAAEFTQAAAAKAQVLHVDAAAPAPVAADRQRIAQVLRNLLSNAVKFTPTGGRIDVRQETRGDTVRVAVVNTGKALTRDQVVRLFEPFSQVHEPTSDGPIGSGLGLVISKGLVEAHGGRIGVDGDAAAGPTFWFTLPLESPGEETPSGRSDSTTL